MSHSQDLLIYSFNNKSCLFFERFPISEWQHWWKNYQRNSWKLIKFYRVVEYLKYLDSQKFEEWTVRNNTYQFEKFDFLWYDNGWIFFHPRWMVNVVLGHFSCSKIAGCWGVVQPGVLDIHISRHLAYGHFKSKLT